MNSARSYTTFSTKVPVFRANSGCLLDTKWQKWWLYKNVGRILKIVHGAHYSLLLLLGLYFGLLFFMYLMFFPISYFLKKVIYIPVDSIILNAVYWVRITLEQNSKQKFMKIMQNKKISHTITMRSPSTRRFFGKPWALRVVPCLSSFFLTCTNTCYGTVGSFGTKKEIINV